MTQYIYARTSTSDQNVNQQAELLQNAYPNSELKVEQASATNMNRPVLDTLLSNLIGGDTIIVYDMSRIERQLT